MSDKTCAACRKEVDQAATLCPHCRSRVDYRYSMDVSAVNIVKIRRPIFHIIYLLVITAITLYAAGLGIVLFGFWIGLGVALIVGAILGAIGNAIGANGSDRLSVSCPGCSHSDDYKWSAGSLAPGKFAQLLCSGCNQKTAVTIQQNPAL